MDATHPAIGGVLMCGDGKLAEFRSVERLDPVTIYPDRVVVAHGEADAAPWLVALTEIARVKVRGGSR